MKENLVKIKRPELEMYLSALLSSSSQSVFGMSAILKKYSDGPLLDKWVTEVKGKVAYQLLWRGSQDGFEAKTFHDKCNNKGPTLTVIVSNNDKIFGGYTSESWGFGGSSGASKQDATAFIYSLTHKAKCAKQKNTKSIIDNSSCGPIFGAGRDIIIWDDCNTRSDNYCESRDSEGATYALPAGADNSFLAGSRNFSVKEIEVYAVIKS